MNFIIIDSDYRTKDDLANIIIDIGHRIIFSAKPCKAAYENFIKSSNNIDAIIVVAMNDVVEEKWLIDKIRRINKDIDIIIFYQSLSNKQISEFDFLEIKEIIQMPFDEHVVVQTLSHIKNELHASANILVADNIQVTKRKVKFLADKMSCEVVYEANTGNRCVEIYKGNSNLIDIVILDYNINGLNGIDTALELKKINEDVKIIFLCSNITNEIIMKIAQIKPIDFIKKPFDSGRLALAIKKAML